MAYTYEQTIRPLAYGGTMALPQYGAPLVGPSGGAVSPIAGGGGQIDYFKQPKPPAIPGVPQPPAPPAPVPGQPMRLQSEGLSPAPAPVPGTVPFTNLDPLTGKPKMLGAKVNAPTDLASLIGAKPGTISAIPHTALGPGTPGSALTAQPTGGSDSGTPGIGGPGMPIDPGAGGNPAAITGPGGANPTPGPNPLPGVDPSGQLPSYILNKYGQDVAGELRGEVPADVQNLLEQQSAEYGVGSGTQGSQFQGYRGLKNLGLTSLDLQKHAEDLIAGQFTKPSDKIALDQSAQKIKDLEDQFNKSFGLEKQKLEAELKLEKDKFAAQQNQLNRENQRNDLESLGLKYGGGSVGGSGGFSGGGYSGGFGPVGVFNQARGVMEYY